jgi:hypothetical protein
MAGPTPGAWCENCPRPSPVVLPLVVSGSIQSWLNHTLMCPRVGLDHSKPRMAVNAPSALAPSASPAVSRHDASLTPVSAHAPAAQVSSATWPGSALDTWSGR